MKKLRTRRGETLVETMIAMLIVMLVVAFLTVAIATSSRINARITNADYAFEALPTAGSLPPITVKINGVEQSVNLHQSSNGYYYYD